MAYQFKEIIVAYDGSEGSEKALKLAAALSKGEQEPHLTVVNVYEEKVETRRVDITVDAPSNMPGYLIEGMPVPPAGLGFNQSEVSTQSIVTNSVEQVFWGARQQLETANASYQALEGNPAESICAYAEEIDADLIIVGSSGKSGLKKLLLGSITQKISQMAPCHVLIAK